MMDCPVSSRLDILSITISAFPSMTWIRVRKGEIFEVKISPESNEDALILPVNFLMMVLVTIEWRTYSIVSVKRKAFGFSNSEFSMSIVIKLVLIIRRRAKVGLFKL